MTSAARPQPLRVPVVDVLIRASLVGTARPVADGLSAALIVVKRPVRIISDPPPPLDPADFAETRPRDVRREELSDYGSLEFERLTPDDPLELDDEELQRESIEPGAEEWSAEADARPGPEAHARAQDSALNTESENDDDESADVLEVSLPPPAPPEALRRAPSHPSVASVAAGVEPRAGVRERTDAEAQAGALQPVAAEMAEEEAIDELDLEIERRIDAATEPARSATPPPPARLSRPDPPDLQTLVATARVQELRPTKPRNYAWWEVFFDDDYLRTVRPPSRQQIAKQCDFIERRLGLKPGASVLDVGCGLGMHVIELSARGYASVGVDLSLAMLARASEEAQTRGMRINFLHADMRELSFDASFDAVTCLGTSLGYFDDETNRKVIERLLRALKPGGALLLDVVNRDHVLRSQPNLIWFEGDGCVCMEESEFNYFTSRLQVKRTVILDSGRQLEHEYSLRLYSLHELGQLMNASGFRVSEVSGRDALPGIFFGQESPNLMIVAARRPEAAGGAGHAPSGPPNSSGG